MGYDNRCFSSDLLAWRSPAMCGIHRDKRLLKDDWRLEQHRRAGDAPATAEQRALLAKLFADGTGAGTRRTPMPAPCRGAIAAHTSVLEKRFNRRMFSAQRRQHRHRRR